MRMTLKMMVRVKTRKEMMSERRKKMKTKKK